MFEFVKQREFGTDDITKIIKDNEQKYNIIFPGKLKEYYSKFDGSKINLVKFDINGFMCEVAKIVPLVDDNYSFSDIVDNDRNDGFIPKSFFPIARDRGGNYYYWDSITGSVFLVFADDIENPFKISNDVDAFFDILDQASVV